MESQHMTQQTFSNFINVSPGTLSSIFNGRTRPTLNIVEAIKEKLPTLNTDWLMFGKGTMFENATGMPSKGEQCDSSEQLLQFQSPSPVSSKTDFRAEKSYGVEMTPNIGVKTEVKYIDKPQRKITEIRVYFDDQHWESFLPQK